MRSQPWRLTVVLVAVLVACAPVEESTPSAQQEPCTLAIADIEAIRGMKATDDAQVLAGDYEGRLNSFSPDIVSMPANHAEIVGREALLAFAKGYPEVVEYQSTYEEIEGCGDFAYLKGLYSIGAQPAGSTELIRDTGRWIWILRKNPEGRWVVTRIISNSDQPLATER